MIKFTKQKSNITCQKFRAFRTANMHWNVCDMVSNIADFQCVSKEEHSFQIASTRIQDLSALAT